MVGGGRSRACSAVLGAVLLQAASVLLQTPSSSAAWGWFMNVTPSPNWKCKEGTQFGCPTPKVNPNCGDPNFTCTVVPAEGYTCTPRNITVGCSKNGAPPFQPKDGGLCVSVGCCGFAKDSVLQWSASPVCTVPVASSARATTHGGGAALGASSIGMLVLTSLLSQP